MSYSYRDLLNRVNQELKDSVLRPLEDLESAMEGVVETIVESLNVEKPKVIATLNPLNECSRFDSGPCAFVLGLYDPGHSLIVVNYKASLSTMLHLVSHHLQALEYGREAYLQLRSGEELRLPWELRPLEINAIVRSAYLARNMPSKVYTMWNNDIKPLVKEIEEGVAKARLFISQVARGIEGFIEKSR